MASERDAPVSGAPAVESGDGPGREQGARDGKPAAARLARDLVRSAWKGTLATVSRTGGVPYGSLVALACRPDGAPLLLLSGLAEHTRNLLADRRASILIDGTSTGPAALTGPRVTLVGRIVDAGGDLDRRRYLARHPDAASFIDFGDFALYALEIEWGHLVAGFGRIVRLDSCDVMLPVGDAQALIEAEPGVLQHMNEDHADAVALMAMQGLAANQNGPDSGGMVAAEPWRIIGCDPEGIDLAAGSRALRLHFPQRVNTPDEVRRALVGMVHAARASAAGAGINP